MKIIRSIRWQYQFGQLLLMACVLITLFSLYYNLHRKELIAKIDRKLQSTLMFSMQALTSSTPQLNHPSSTAPGPGGRPQPNNPGAERRPPPRQAGRAGNAGPPQDGASPKHHAQKTLDDAVESGLYAISWLDTNPDAEVSRFGDVPLDLTYQSYQVRPEGPQLHTRDDAREIIFFHRRELLVVIGQPLSSLNAPMHKLLLQLLTIGASILLLGFLGGMIISRRVLNPILQISQTAEAISQGNSNERIELADAPAELEGLARTLNQTFDHLDESIRTQKRFSADASHELRTPIAVVIAQCQAALKRDRSTDEYKTVLTACLRAGDRMKTMANSLLDLIRIDNEAGSLTKALSDLNEIICEAAEDADHLSALHPVAFQPLEKPLMAEIDWNRIHQVIMNLLNNAVTHNPQGCSIRIALRKDNHSAIITIADTGSGIPADALPHIFDRFYRADKSRSREQGGTGLGLSIVKKLIIAHGGSITASSSPNQGTTFTIKLPT